ncbi:MAG: hypothetical protein IIX44_00085 [Clostridia bacterium]|nr:hypothetical protein [Clostridia bacterium]
MFPILRRLIALLLIICTLTSLAACRTDQPDETTVESTETEPAVTEPIEEAVETFDIIKDGKLLYPIVRPEVASQALIRAALKVHKFINDSGVKSDISDWGDKTGEKNEILFGISKYFPKEALDGIDLSALGMDGFVIKHYGNKILIAASNDTALADAAEYFINNVLDIKGGNATMPKDYLHIESQGLFLSELKIGGIDIKKFSVTCDAGFEEPANYVKELIKAKCGAEISDGGEKKIILTADGAKAHTVTANIEDGNLVIRAENLEAMKKAIVCFWYENIAYTTASFDLPADTAYSRDLDQTIFYSDYGVTQSDSICCREQLYDVHAKANEKGYKVFADYGAKYYIASVGRSVIINTDVEWGNAQFTIDDSEVTPDKRGNWIFTLLERTDLAYNIDTIKTLDRDMTNLGVTFPQSSIVTFYDDKSTHYVRYGGNADNGQTKRDSVVVDKNGNIDMDAPLMWDFDNITLISVLPIEEETRYISGGIFTTIANQAPSEYTYYARGLKINRSNTVLCGMKHYITGEGPTGAPYNGFLSINNCAYVTVKNCIFTGHKTYQSPTTAMGSYDIGMGNAISVSFINCTQANDINDSKYWGVSGTNYCKNFVYDGCVLSRFDAHKGVANATIKNSVIGHAGASVIGYGTLLIENSTFFTSKIIDLRSDYGSTWEGEIIVRNCTISPMTKSDVYVFKGSNKGEHDFGYPCYVGTNITIDGLTVDNANKAYIFANLNPNCTSDKYQSKYPFYAPETVTVKNITISVKEGLQVSPNEYFFAKTKFIYE